MTGYCDVFFPRIILKRMSTEAHVYMRRHQGAKVKHFDVSNVIYHKFSHGAVSYTLNGKKVNVMVELHFNSCSVNLQISQIKFSEIRKVTLRYQ